MTLDYAELPCSLNDYCCNFPLPSAYDRSSVAYAPSSSIVCRRLATAAVAATVWHFAESCHVADGVVCSLLCLLHLTDAVFSLSVSRSLAALFIYLAHQYICRIPQEHSNAKGSAAVQCCKTGKNLV